MDQQEIIKMHPSICYTCEWSRKPAADEVIKDGYVGCCIPIKKGNQEFVSHVHRFNELAEGWVDLKARVFGERSGIITNLQLLTLEVTSCREYQEKQIA